MQSLEDIKTHGVKLLAEAGIREPTQEVEGILERLVRQKALYTASIDEELIEKFLHVISLRCERKPIDRIFGETEFCNLRFLIDDEVFRPYPETQDLVDYTLGICLEMKLSPTILDVGTGGGCILISLLKGIPNSVGMGIDHNEMALTLAAKNAKLNDVSNRATFLCNDWIYNLTSKFDIIISNPPRVATENMPLLMSEMKDYDPADALDGGVDGLRYYKSLAVNFCRITHSHSIGLFQINESNARDVFDVFDRNGFRDIEVLPNILGKPTAIIVKK